MVKETIIYTDYNGVEHTEEFYFNLTQAEVAEMELSVDGGLSKQIEDIVKEQNPGKILSSFKKLILLSYGVKSEDGKRFVKNDQLREEFSQTEAYSVLFMKLASDSDAASNFVNGIMPVVAPAPEKLS